MKKCKFTVNEIKAEEGSNGINKCVLILFIIEN